MNEKKGKRRFAFANRFHRQIFLLVSLAAIIPTLLISMGLYYLIFGITANEVAIPEAIAYNIIPAAQKVSLILLFATPITIIIILILAYRVTHNIVGPFDRIVNDLDERIENRATGPIVIRKGDKFRPLVDKINKLLEKIGK